VNQPDCESRPFRGRYLKIAALVVWVLIVGAAALIAPALVSVTLSVLVPGALVIVAATLLGRGWGATLVDLALVAILVLGVLYALRNTLEWYPCDASGTDPRCGEVSNAPGP
jgi:hypothetical protein